MTYSGNRKKKKKRQFSHLKREKRCRRKLEREGWPDHAGPCQPCGDFALRIIGPGRQGKEKLTKIISSIKKFFKE